MEKVNLDPRCKLFIFLSVCFVVMNTPNSILNFCLSTFIMLLGTYLGEFKGLKNKYITIFIALIIEQLLKLLEQTPANMFILIIIVLLKLYIPMMMSFYIVYKTTTISEFMAGFKKMNLPQSFVIPFAVMFRFIPTVNEEWNGIRQAMGFRGIGLRFKTVFMHPIQTAEYILVPLLFSCVNVMDELVSASLARGLDSTKNRTCIIEVRFGIRDYIIMTLMVIFMICALSL